MDYPIRALKPEDRELAEDFFRNLSHEGNLFYNYCQGNEKALYSALEAPKPGRVDFGAFDQTPEGKPLMVAHIYLWALDTKLPWLGICIRDGYMGKHLGRTLLAYLEQYCKGKQCGGLCLTTHVANVRGQVLYRSCGYQYFGTAPDGEFLFIKPFPNNR